MDGEKVVKRILGKKNDRVHVDCVRIFTPFDPPEPEGLPSFPLQEFLCETTNFDKFMERIRTEKNEDLRELLEFRLQNITFDVCFAFGFVLGQMFEIPRPEVKKSVEALKKFLIEEEVLPFIPREKKRGGSHGSAKDT